MIIKCKFHLTVYTYRVCLCEVDMFFKKFKEKNDDVIRVVFFKFHFDAIGMFGWLGSYAHIPLVEWYDFVAIWAGVQMIF